MPLPRPVHALIAFAITGGVYVAPWLMGALPTGPAFTHVEMPSVEERRISQPIYIPPPEPELPLAAEPLDEALAEALSEPPPQVEDLPTLGTSDGQVLTTLATTGPGRLRARGELKTAPDLPLRVVKPKPKKTPKRRTRECDPPDERVAEVSDTSFRIERSLIDHYANHIAEIEELAASWWARDDDDERRGFRIGRMGCGALLRQAGFRNGDVITHINGMSITSWSEGVKAYLAVRNKHLLWVGVERRGEPTRVDFLLVDDGEAAVTIAQGDRWDDPSMLVDRELELAELPWLERRGEKRKDRRETRGHERGERKAEKARERASQASR